MMEVPHSYYEDEVRNGFYIPSLMKRAWAASMEVLQVIADICEKHQIKWFLDSGSLIGAIRHKGFIPWDDDLDICMLRGDYTRFLEVVQAELPEHYQILNLHTEPEYSEMFSRVANQHAICFLPEHMQKFHGFPFVVGVDIFPLDYVSPDEEEEAFRCNVIDMLYKFQSLIGPETPQEVIEPQLQQIEQMIGITIDRNGHIKNQINLWIERLSCLYAEEEAKEIVLLPAYIKYGNNRFNKHYYDRVVWVDFEYMRCPVPALYDSVLSEKYGDYMKIIRDWETHDYPFYGEQAQIAKERVGFEYIKYQMNAQEVFANRRRKQEGKAADRKRRLVILPYSADAWRSVESIWRAAKADPMCEVHVIAPPRYEKDWDGTVLSVCDDSDAYPKEVEVTPPEKLDLKTYHPDVIITQDPFDQFNPALTAAPDYYTDKLREVTDMLVYIPHFLLEDFDVNDGKGMMSLEHFCTMPGSVYADLVILQSEAMRSVWIEALTAAAGESTREVWEEKILGTGTPLRDGGTFARAEGTRKVLYYTGISSFLQQREKMIGKVRSVFAHFKEQEDRIQLVWKPQALIADTLPELDKELWEEYRQLVEEFEESGRGILADTKKDESLVAECDAYYGDPSEFVHMFRQINKPAIIQDIQI